MSAANTNANQGRQFGAIQLCASIVSWLLAIRVVTVLTITASVKACLECAEILLLPQSFAVTPVLLVAIVLSGIALSVWLGRAFIADNRWKELNTSLIEKVTLAVLVLGIVCLNVPLFLQ
ncbi:MAG: hypothetical protein JMDDDDMK_01477 [Acidobacteria bacterium]|nr:hypothetical protein [Acidobacteriota bacterium]